MRVAPVLHTSEDCDRELDITDKICPLTFVHTRLTIDSMEPGAVLAILLNGGEPLENVPRSIKELGHEIISVKPIANLPGRYRLRVLIRQKVGEKSRV